MCVCVFHAFSSLHLPRTLLPHSLAHLPSSRCRQFPSLINCCTIDWYSEWPDDALLSVSRKFLANTDLGSDEVKDSIANM
jgi:dynein heavy chain